jgi:hypothetical protein
MNMAKKNTIELTAEGTKTPDPRVDPWTDGDGTLYLSERDLNRLNLAHARGVALRAQADGMRTKAKLLQMQVEQQTALLERQAQAHERAIEDIEKRHLPDLVAEVSRVYGIDFERSTFDSDTGKIHVGALAPRN